MNKAIAAIVASLLWTTTALTAEQPTLELIMSDPDWIGNAPESPWWSDDASAVYYQQKREGEDIRDTFSLNLKSAEITPVDRAEQPLDSGRSRVYNQQRSHAAWQKDGDILLKQLADGVVTRVTHSTERESNLSFSADGQSLFFLRDDQFYSYTIAGDELRQLTNVQARKDPDEKPGFDALREQQSRTYATLVEDKRRAEAVKAAQRQATNDLPTPVYLGDDHTILSRHLSPAGDRLALVVSDAGADSGQTGKMPNYVTEDGYVEIRDVRSRVSRNEDTPQQVLLVSLADGTQELLDFSKLDGIDKDPLSDLRKSAQSWHVEAGADPEEVKKTLEAPDLRTFTVDGFSWNNDGSQLALQLVATDFKDRWLVTVSAGSADWQLQHRLTDPAWINWDYNDFGWLEDNRRLWFLSEESGYSHLYIKAVDERRSRQLTQGDFVVREPVIDPAQQFAYVVTNRAHPGNYEIYRVPLNGGDLQQVTDLDGVSRFVLSPDGRQLLVSRSAMDRHADLYLGAADGQGDLRQLTNTVKERYAGIDWVVPRIIEVPSSHTDRPIYSKLYLPPDFDANKRYPAVMFVHGAGYTQNAHLGWPYYFREFMFHTVLAEAGYVVLDMDYRASKGYGRDWRAEIYRNMGHPELEDFLDGVDFLATNHSVDRERVGIYGGSYGGFMTFMALFREPQAFAAGAALRPVVDWMHYNHGYTARILNTPEVDPEAYQRSSPVNFAAGLERPLLIAVGMQDDNVFFQDSVLLVQRLIELKKENFETAIYPMDPHGFIHPESWLDEYRRIFKLMETHVK